MTRINKNFHMPLKEELLALLKKNVDLFAWTVVDMPRTDSKFMSHYLATFSGVRPIAQQRRKMSPNRALEVQKQVLLDTRFIWEVMYPTWLSNIVIVKKSNGKLRMCADYTNLNKVCPKDSYPLSSIDGIIDIALGFQFLSFRDAYSGYN